MYIIRSTINVLQNRWLPSLTSKTYSICTNSSLKTELWFTHRTCITPSHTTLRINASSLYTPVRLSTIFTSVSADRLWEGVTGPKGSTKKRSRGKRRVTRPKIDLNRGQRVGMGKANMEWPGLNTPLFDKSGVREIKEGKVNDAYFERLREIHNKSNVKKKRMKLPPLLRGWTGSRLEGQSIGPPTPDHPEFDSRVIEMKSVATMTATVGRYRRFSVLVATGNGHGLCGIGKAKAISLSAAVRRAKQKASQNIISLNLKDNRTLWHIGHIREWHSIIFAKAGVEGSGLICHRVIRTLCELIGIKDMYAKVEGSTKNYQAIARGFLRLLSQQESYTDLANRIGLNVVEFDADYDMHPRLHASPAPGCSIDPNRIQSQSDIEVKAAPMVQSNDEPRSILCISHPERHRPRKPIPESHETFLDDLVEVGEGPTVKSSISELLLSGERDLDALVLGGRIPLIRGKPKPFYWNLPGNLKVAADRYRFRNHDATKRQREAYEFLDQLQPR